MLTKPLNDYLGGFVATEHGYVNLRHVVRVECDEGDLDGDLVLVLVNGERVEQVSADAFYLAASSPIPVSLVDEDARCIDLDALLSVITQAVLLCQR